MPWGVPDMPRGGRAGRPALHELPEQQAVLGKCHHFYVLPIVLRHPLINSKCHLTRELSTAAFWRVSLSHYWGLRGDDNSFEAGWEVEPLLFFSHLCSVEVVSSGYHKAASSWLPPSVPHIPSEMPGNKHHREKTGSIFPGSCLIIRLPKWNFRALSHHICSILRCFIALWEHKKASREKRVHSSHGRNPATKHVCKYKGKAIFTLHSDNSLSCPSLVSPF